MTRNDTGREYKTPFSELCSQNTIIPQTTTLYSP